LKAKQERRVAVSAVLCSGHILVVVFRGVAGIEHVIVSERPGERPVDILVREGLLDEVKRVIALDDSPEEYAEFTASLKRELDKLICREGVYRAR